MTFKVVDLFSGAGGMSAGFHAHKSFSIVGAADVQQGKPSSGIGTLGCNATYKANIGLEPLEVDLRRESPASVLNELGLSGTARDVDVLISCAPCTGFSRTVRKSLVEDDKRNSLVRKSLDYIIAIRPKVFLMENVGEMLAGRFVEHYQYLRSGLQAHGYEVHAHVHSLDCFGLPQRRKRALVVACRSPEFQVRSLDDLWRGWTVRSSALTVRRAIARFPAVAAGEVSANDPMHVSPSFTRSGLRRLQLIPPDGGDWPSLNESTEGRELLTPTMRRFAEQGRVGPYRDVYGRMFWDRPSATIKRECAHIGNGRYAHPEQDRLCSVREMAVLQGFPDTYSFEAGSIANMYRHVGDAVPPLISYQLAHLSAWMLTGRRPGISEIVMPNTSLRTGDLLRTPDHFALESRSVVRAVI